MGSASGWKQKLCQHDYILTAVLQKKGGKPIPAFEAVDFSSPVR